MTGQVHAPAALPSENDLQVPIGDMTCTVYTLRWTEKISAFVTNRSPVVRNAAVVTEIYRLHNTELKSK